MQNLSWSPHMSLGIAEMDTAHKALIAELSDLMRAPDHEFSARLQRLIVLLEVDFREEEMLMEKIAYSGLREHRAQHADLLGALHHVAPQAMNGDFVLARQVLHMLPQWFLSHLLKMDTALVLELNRMATTTGDKNVETALE